MKGTCIHCHRFTFDTNSLSTKIVIAKLRALAFGVGEILNGIEGAIKDRIANISLLGMFGLLPFGILKLLDMHFDS